MSHKLAAKLHTSMTVGIDHMRSRMRREDGATAVEYGLMVALIAAVIIVAVTALGTNLKTVFQGVADKITMAAPTT